MRTLTVLTLLFFAVVGNAQNSNYFANNPSWDCGEYSSGGFTRYNYYLNGNDTVVGGYNYHQLWKKGYSSSGSDFNYLFLLLRQAGNSIRYYEQGINSDQLLTDYEIEIGDSLKYIHRAVQSGFNELAVQKIDSTVVGNEFRKLFYFDTLNNGLVITEGIGFQIYESITLGEFIQPIGIAFGTDYGIHCYGQNSILQWYSDTNDTADCNLNITVGLTEYEQSEISLFPNPASNQISVCSLHEIQNLKLTAIDGKESLTVKGSKANVSSLARGLYIVTITFFNGQTMQRTLVVE